jgi:hypothetical protein
VRVTIWPARKTKHAVVGRRKCHLFIVERIGIGRHTDRSEERQDEQAALDRAIAADELEELGNVVHDREERHPVHGSRDVDTDDGGDAEQVNGHDRQDGVLGLPDDEDGEDDNTEDEGYEDGGGSPGVSDATPVEAELDGRFRLAKACNDRNE